MNILEAVAKALEGKSILCLDRNEWIICSGGTLRWKSNRQPANLSVKDIMSEKWICEDDLITISKLQLEDALKTLKAYKKNSDGEIIEMTDVYLGNIESFFEAISNYCHTNKLRHNGTIEEI